MSRYNQDTRHSNPSFSVSAFSIREQIQILTINKPAHPGNKAPERLALNSSFHTTSEERLAILWLGLTSHGSLLDGGGEVTSAPISPAAELSSRFEFSSD